MLLLFSLFLTIANKLFTNKHKSTQFFVSLYFFLFPGNENNNNVGKDEH